MSKKSKKSKRNLQNSKFLSKKIYLNVDYECPQFIPEVKSIALNRIDIRQMYF